jgi:glyoxalase family protein
MTHRTLPVTAGIHHVTTIASLAQRTYDFHVNVLGLRVVKRSVNFDDPGTWHLYFGDATGAPGTLLTLFPYENGRQGRIGEGQFSRVAFAVPLSSFAFWIERFLTRGIHVEGPSLRFGDRILTVHDPDGLTYEIVGTGYAAALPGWDGGSVPATHAIRGLHGVTLHEPAAADGDLLLRELFGYSASATEGDTTRFIAAGEPGLGKVVDLRRTSGTERGTGGAGTVHHVAFRAADDAAQALVREAVVAKGLGVTEFIDRQYFRSIYFRTPGGALFEVATDPPGMLVDEPLATLGTTLQLPPQYEIRRAAIAAQLPALESAEVA